MDRLQAYEVNQPEFIFDRIENEIAAACQEGAPIKLMIIDSLTGISGVKELNSDSVSNHLIGDHALTIQKGLKRILPVIRKHRIALVLTAQVRAEMNQLEQRRGHETKMAAAWATRHYAEYFMEVTRNDTAKGEKNLLEEPLVDETLNSDMRVDRKAGDVYGHRIRCEMRDNSMGCRGRVGEFTFDYKKGVINRHEEVFLLGCARGVIERPSTVTYKFGDKEWRGKATMVGAINEDKQLSDSIMKQVRSKDLYEAPSDEPVKIEV